MSKTKGVFLIAKNNSQIDYVKQAVFLAKRIKKYLNLPTTVATDCVGYLKGEFDSSVFDNIIELDWEDGLNSKLFFDGAMSNRTASFKNSNRASVYDLTPYDETLVIDTDYIISNNMLANVFNLDTDLALYKKSNDIAKVRNELEFEHISDTSIDFYWATVIFFRKTKKTQIFFDLVKHIEEEWTHYKRVYQIRSQLFRNDFAFSIAAHILNGFCQGNVVSELPGSMLYTTDKDILWKIDKDEMMFLVEKKDYYGEYTAIKTKGQNIHVMNKFSLNRVIDEVNNV